VTTRKTPQDSPFIVLLLLVAACVTFWKFRIIGTGELPTLTLANVDIYAELYPMAKYGFGSLIDGHLPLWNPYQLCGIPFLAAPHVGLLYPGNLFYLVFDTATATEVSLVAHLIFGGFAMWLLVREYGMSSVGGLAAAVTFMWSGWMVFFVNQTSHVAAMSWLPMTVWLIERTIRGSRFAPIGLALAVACQGVNGEPEFFVSNMYVGVAVTLLRLGQLSASGHAASAAKTGVLLLAMVALGLGLAAPQLLPTAEMARLSVRAAGSLTLDAAREFGVVPSSEFLHQTLRGSGIVLVGFLPFFGLILGVAVRGQRLLWIFAATLALLAASLAFGGKIFELYFQTPLGRLFRAPHKMLHIYSFAQAIMSAIALEWLVRRARLKGRQLWIRWEWLAALFVAGMAIFWGWRQGNVNGYLVAAFAALLVFGLLPAGAWRMAPIIGLLILQAAVLFVAANVSGIRPSQQPGVFDTSEALFDSLRGSLDDGRIYLSPRFTFVPSLTPKQGLLHRLPVVFDYGPLFSARHATYIQRAANRPAPRSPFSGVFPLGAYPRLKLMDLMGTRYYVTPFGSELERTLDRLSRMPATGGITRLDVDGITPWEAGDLRVYERSSYLPRAYLVGKAQVVDGPERALTAISASGFRPRRAAVIELEGKDPPSLGEAVRRGTGVAPTDRSVASGGGGVLADGGNVTIVEDEPERVVVRVDAAEAGFLVLADTYYPGWHAYVSGIERTIYRADYLFRAVEVVPGTSTVVFEYHPASLRHGVYAASASALLLLAFALTRGRQRAVAEPALPSIPGL